MNKNNMSISSNNVEILKDYVEEVKDTTKTIRTVNDLNVEMKELQHRAFETEQENNSLKYELIHSNMLFVFSSGEFSK